MRVYTLREARSIVESGRPIPADAAFSAGDYRQIVAEGLLAVDKESGTEFSGGAFEKSVMGRAVAKIVRQNPNLPTEFGRPLAERSIR